MTIFITRTLYSACRTSLNLCWVISSLSFSEVKWSSVYIFKNGQGSCSFSFLDPGRFKFLKSIKDENDLECLFFSPGPSLSLDWSGSGSI